MKNYTMSPSQMPMWKKICKEYADKNDYKLLFVNETSFGVETNDGHFRHIYIEELAEELKGA